MEVQAGDRIILESERVGTPDREGEILEIIDHPTGPEYLVRWDDGRETSIRPASGSARVESTHDEPTGQ